MKYVLGVDGGNTKTDYLLFDLEGTLVRHLRAGTCSHEQLGMEGAHREMDARIRELLDGADIRREEVTASAFGLAGIDQSLQQAALIKIVRDMGFENSVAVNDSFLGIKAGSESGVGISSINGTGTAAGGIDLDGNWMQVGGLGYLSGDDAGGSYIASRTLRAIYDAIFRFGEKTALLEPVLALFGCDAPEEFHLAISTKYQYGDAVKPLNVLHLLLKAADAGDAVALQIVRDAADTLARSAAGCAVRLRFGAEIPVVLIGSVWTKGRNKAMIDHFQAQFTHYAKKPCTLHVLEVPPAAGSVLWALELATGEIPAGDLRARIFAQTKGL